MRVVRRVRSSRKRISEPQTAVKSKELEPRHEPVPDRAPRVDVSLTLKHFQRRRENSLTASEGKRLYLRVGDEVNHLRHEEWGIGVAMEVMTSSIPGGTCLVRVRFQD